MVKKSFFSQIFTCSAPVVSLVLTVAMLVLASCPGQETDGLRYGFSSEPATLDPLSPSNTADGRSILFNVFEGLVKPDNAGRLRPCVAESVTIGEEKRVYDFRLRKNIHFHDGSPLTSDDVKFTLDTAVNAGHYGFSAIEKVETDGDYGIRVILKSADPEFLPFLTIGIVKDGSTDRDKKAVGTGPFYIESYAVQRSLILRKFKDYWQDDLPKLDKVTIVFFENADALIPGLYGGSIDGASLTGALAHQLDSRRFDIMPSYTAMVHLLALNNKAAPFDDLRIRQAVNFGTDIQEIIDTAFYGQGEPSGSPLIPGLSIYYEQSLADPYHFDPQEALKLLAESGYGEGGQRLSFEITVPSNYTMHVDTAQVVASRLGQIGIDVNIRLVDWATWLSDVYFGRKYQATVISLDSLIVSPSGFLSRYRSDSDNNFINFSDTEFDQVYDAAIAETNENRRINLYKQAQRIISANAASVYIQDILEFKAFQAGIYGGVLNYPLYVIDFASMYVK